MKIYCNHCGKDCEVWIERSGPHLKATCVECFNYIKFLDKRERKQLQIEEDLQYQKIRSEKSNF